MLELTHMTVDGAPRTVGPFSHAVRAGDFLFVTGQMPTSPVSGALVGSDVVAQTRQVVANLQTVLAGAGLSLDRTVFARIYLTDFERDYAPVNRYWQTLFAPGRLPGRTCIGVSGLAVRALVEIDLVAAF